MFHNPEAKKDDLVERRDREKNKYFECYNLQTYRMGADRHDRARRCLASIKGPESYLDVGCGRGEMLDDARKLGFNAVIGVEVVDYLVNEDQGVVKGEAYNLPFTDGSFQVVSLFDVIEHLLPDDAEPTCRERERVAYQKSLITANNRPSVDRGVELHINRLPYDEWDAFFHEVFSGRVTWMKELSSISETWRIDFE